MDAKSMYGTSKDNTSVKKKKIEKNLNHKAEKVYDKSEDKRTNIWAPTLPEKHFEARVDLRANENSPSKTINDLAKKQNKSKDEAIANFERNKKMFAQENAKKFVSNKKK